MTRPVATAKAQYLYDDWPEILATVKAAETLRGEAGADDRRGLALRRSADILASGLIVKKSQQVNWRVCPEAPLLSREHLDTMQELGLVVDRLLVAVSARLSNSIGLRQKLGFPVFPEEEALLEHFGCEPPAFLRLDLTPDAAGQLKLLEIQTVVGGLGITQVLRQAYGPTPGLPGIAAAYQEAVLSTYRRHCARHGIAAQERPLVGAYMASTSLYRHEVFSLAVALSKVEMVVAPWRKVIKKTFLGLPDGRVPDLFFRMFRAETFFLGLESMEKQMMDWIKSRPICLVNPWLDVLEDKRILALVHDPAGQADLGGLMSKADWATLQKATPATRQVTVDNADQFKNKPRHERTLYLKKGRSNMCRAIFDGQQTNGRPFDHAVDVAAGQGDWIAQDAVRGNPWDFEYLDPGDRTLKTMKGYVRLTPFYYRTADGQMALADVCITAREQRSRVHGASDSCIVVPRLG